MTKLERLVNLATSKGMDILSIEFVTANRVKVIYHSLKHAGRIPEERYCRDHRDYELRYAIFMKNGRLESPVYKEFGLMLDGELKRLKHYEP